MEVNADLYDFLKEHETGLYTKGFHKDKTVYAIVFVDFHDLKKFVEILGSFIFEDAGLEVVMKENYICIPLNDIIEGDCHYLSSYKNCFSEHDWKHYKDMIAEMERE
ncbi:hypothetical protein BC351_01125 [Paenibacillus ferrarius]|uniref:Uncharacterized protein n=1 Tax=Paenibacillus ferrarius TaxID=1469647 RepID=A0A1V4HTN3_9BACL|nr:hypothetical protein [Paenibacillus ferrarius]OPH61873.1 hypothetical protein BC351_01125 [Paenibacillus ferrarius]